MYRIDKEFIIYIFTPDFISSFINIILIKNGRGNRPADAVAAGFDLSERRVLNPAPIKQGKDEMKIYRKPLHFIDRGFLILNDCHSEPVSESYKFKVRC